MIKIKVLQLTSLIIIGILLFADVNQRLWPTSGVKLKNKTSYNVVKLTSPQLSPAQLNQLAQWYELTDEATEELDNDSTDISGLAANEPSKGLLNGYLLELKAITSIANSTQFNDTVYYCLIEKTHLKTKEKTIIKLQNKQLFLGYSVDITNSKTVRLVNKLDPESGTIVQNENKANLVLAMYKSNNDTRLSGKNNEN